MVTARKIEVRWKTERTDWQDWRNRPVQIRVLRHNEVVTEAVRRFVRSLKRRGTKVQTIQWKWEGTRRAFYIYKDTKTRPMPEPFTKDYQCPYYWLPDSSRFRWSEKLGRVV